MTVPMQLRAAFFGVALYATWQATTTLDGGTGVAVGGIRVAVGAAVGEPPPAGGVVVAAEPPGAVAPAAPPAPTPPPPRNGPFSAVGVTPGIVLAPPVAMFAGSKLAAITAGPVLSFDSNEYLPVLSYRWNATLVGPPSGLKTSIL